MRTELPKYWCVKNTYNCLEKYASKIPRNTWYCNAINHYYFYKEDNIFYFNAHIPIDYEEITLKEFEILFLNNPQK